MSNFEQLETITREICDAFDVYAPPVPIELMLQQPVNGMWEELDPSQLSGSFMRVDGRYSPRMSLTRLLARHIAQSEWGKAQGLLTLIPDPDTLNVFARMLIMPQDMVEGLTSSTRNPKAMSLHFEVPEDEARQRLIELI